MEVTAMAALAILQMDGIELRTTDRLTCRTLYRMIGTAMSDDDVAELVEPPRREDRE
jgi:hypothetical protein